MLKNWISAFRLRTLPLALSTVLMGNALAVFKGAFNPTIFWLTILTTLLLQILSNLANDYGDGIKGTDNVDRVGPKRAIQSGAISPKQMKTAVIIFALLSLLSGIGLLLVALKMDLMLFIFFLLGIAAIGAAIKYTVGKSAYGYQGLGDLFVFIFFGLVGVLGAYYLQVKTIDYWMALPAIAIGAFSAAVLNLNNMRDIENDGKVGKNTLVVKLGLKHAKKYHYTLFLLAYIAIFTFVMTQTDGRQQGVLLIISALVGLIHTFHIKRVILAKAYAQFDPELKIVALSTLLFSVACFFTFYLL
ncbi:1,4-dihydroxy-2-naphthoate octaprenyltransferase [Putridiphycobacter roseus]|uniref:1,4-dihydroxy-2-naphthoate octaprenyltransferase n=1 Tax=Putridiphycobacter roseus TaxID=2219161 RepID=A0A2W1N9Z9_9FLAO|nr:1,4-dihydroxy-2-naphthoate octaprenyltransferase [Putridiphycobacter roseus]PZE16095.1 1,4-dihydroxy-2-naphthoate octaprenyltransferase [Putridiphycobacter roseus]